MLGPGRQPTTPDWSPPTPSIEVTDFQGSGCVPHLLRGGNSEERILAGERSASPQYGGCFLRGCGSQAGVEECRAPMPLCRVPLQPPPGAAAC